jgi:hypothetical protein
LKGLLNSPHLQAAKSNTQYLIAIATNDDQGSRTGRTLMKEVLIRRSCPRKSKSIVAPRTAGVRWPLPTAATSQICDLPSQSPVFISFGPVYQPLLV